MQTAMRWLKVRRQVDVISISLPEPATHQGLIDAYAAALAAHPKVRMILLTQVSHRNGLVLPVADITAMARAKGWMSSWTAPTPGDSLISGFRIWGRILLA